MGTKDRMTEKHMGILYEAVIVYGWRQLTNQSSPAYVSFSVALPFNVYLVQPYMQKSPFL